jgi:hypothetical protein
VIPLVLFAIICVGFALYDAARQIRAEVMRAETLRLCEQRYAQCRRELIQLAWQDAEGRSSAAASEYAGDLRLQMVKLIRLHEHYSGAQQ